MLAVIRKDLRIFFSSPLAYVTLALFIFLTAFAFNSQWSALVPDQLPEASMRGMLYFAAVLLLFLTPLLTMRSFADEERLQTMELLKTAPISDQQIVFAKFLTSFIFLCVMVVSTAIYPLIIYLVAEPDTGPMILAYLGLCFIGSAFISVGIFTSSLVRSPMLAAILSFVALLLLWFVGGMENDWSAHVSVIRHLESFSIGVLDFTDVGYYIFFTAGFLFLTIRWQEAARWK